MKLEPTVQPPQPLDHPAGQVVGTTMHRASTRCGGLRRTATYVTGDQHRRPPFTWEAQCRFVESLLGDSPPGTLALLLRGTSPPDTAKPAEQAVHQWLRHSCTQAEAKPLVEPGQAEHEEPWTHAALRLARWIQVAQADTLETTARWLANSEAGQHTATDQSSCIPSMQTESAGGMDSVGSVHSVDSVGSVHSVDSVDSVGSVDSADGVNSVRHASNLAEPQGWPHAPAPAHPEASEHLP
jgi:hypothetical protein